MTSISHKTAAVTGAASGIGRALAIALSRRGCHLALCDIDGSGLAETAAMVDPEVRTTTHVVDLANRDAIYAWADDVIEAHPQVDLLFNNAGVTMFGRLDEVSDDEFAWILDVNLWGVIHGVRAFLPHLQRRPEAHIVNVSSINAYLGFIRNGPYNISKHAVAGFTETLWQELAGSPVRATLVHPGGIKTNIARNARHASDAMADHFERLARTTPERAAEVILRSVTHNQERVFIGTDAWFMQLAKRLWPVWSVLATGRLQTRLNRRAGVE